MLSKDQSELLENNDASDEDLWIDVSKFKELTSKEIIEILGLTIKRDNENKLLTFFCMLSAYTEDSQFNISFNAPSSSGKSYIPIEISDLFPKSDVMLISYCSPSSFYHEQGTYDKEKNTITVDLARKIIIFLDQPNSSLLERLRSLLSHDRKEIISKITDKNQKGGNRTKTVVIKGFPSVIFCTAGFKMDEQEATRFMLLSPEINQEKIREAIQEKIKKSSDPFSYLYSLEVNQLRQSLKKRIIAIKKENIENVIIESPEKIEKMFFSRIKVLKPKHQRDMGRIISLIKVFTLLNVWFRERKGSDLIATNRDIEEAFKLWDIIAEPQELNIPPYILDFYKNIILPLYEKNINDENPINLSGITRQAILKRHYDVYGRLISDWQLRREIIPALEISGMIRQEQDSLDKRKLIIYPTLLTNISNNSVHEGGVGSNSANELEKK